MYYYNRCNHSNIWFTRFIFNYRKNCSLYKLLVHITLGWLTSPPLLTYNMNIQPIIFCVGKFYTKLYINITCYHCNFPKKVFFPSIINLVIRQECQYFKRQDTLTIFMCFSKIMKFFHPLQNITSISSSSISNHAPRKVSLLVYFCTHAHTTMFAIHPYQRNAVMHCIATKDFC